MTTAAPAAKAEKIKPEGVASAKPGTKDPKAEKPAKPAKPAKIPHPFIGSEDANIYPLKEVPADFDRDKHLPLKKSDFADETMWYDIRIADMEARLERLKQDRDEAKALGNVKDRAAAKRLAGMGRKIAEIQSKLEGEGVDTGEILRNAGIDLDGLRALLAAADKKA